MAKKLLSIIDTFTDVCGRYIAWLTLGMMVVMFISVVLRYLFQVGFVMLDESIVYMHSMVFMLGAAFTLKRGGHVRVDIFYNRFSDVGKAWVDFFGTLFLLLPVSIFIGIISWEYVASSWRILENSPKVDGIPAIFLLKSLIILMSSLLIIQGIAELLRNFLILSGAKLNRQEKPDQSTGI